MKNEINEIINNDLFIKANEVLNIIEKDIKNQKNHDLIKSRLIDFENNMYSLEVYVNEQDSIVLSNKLKKELDVIKSKYKDFKLDYSRLCLLNESNKQREFIENRNKLLSFNDGENKSRQEIQNEAHLLNQSQNITKTLTRTSNLMKQEIERVQYTEQVLEQDNEKLKNLSNVSN